MAITAHYLGHIVLYVKDMATALDFYRDLLGFREVGSLGDQAVALTSGRTHHELLLIEVGEAPGPLQGRRRGLYHVGIKVGDSLTELRDAKQALEAAGITLTGASDHTVTQSLYLLDPDGNEVELYVDDPNVDWRTDPGLIMAPIKPLRL